MPRIKQITDKTALPPERHAEFDALVEVLHGVRGPFSILMHSPGLAQKVMEGGAHVRLKSTLQRVELAATVGQYQYISAINTTFDVQPAAADADRLPV